VADIYGNLYSAGGDAKAKYFSPRGKPRRRSTDSAIARVSPAQVLGFVARRL
jgi:hypothetical protein